MFKKDKCPICGNKASQAPTDKGGYIFECVRCGEFVLSGVYSVHLGNLTDIQQTNLSGYIRDNQSNYQRCIITRQIIEENKNTKVKLNPQDKADKILLTLEEISAIPGSEIEITEESKYYYLLLGKAYIINNDEWIYILQDYLEDELNYIEFIKYASAGPLSARMIKITPKGWDHLSKLGFRNQDSNTAFIAMWFNDKVKPTKEVIKQAIRDAGYDPKIVNEDPFNGDIVNQIITLINQSRFVVADLTGQRQGVYFEAGYAKGLNLPVIYTVRDDQIDPKKPTKDNPDLLKVHFDLNHQNLISWNNKNLDKFQNMLTNQITATIGVGPLKKNK
jgi:nucleoside 2-deoxyribosyltransferase